MSSSCQAHAELGFDTLGMVNGMNNINSKLDLDRLGSLIIFLKDDIESFVPKRVMAAYSEYDYLLNNFVAEFGRDFGPEQIEKARQDPEYFLRLIELARTLLE